MKIDSCIDRILFTQDQLENRIKELSQWVNETYKNSDNLILVGLLKGSFPFLAQLIKNVEVDFVIDFMIASSYGGGESSSGNVKIVLDLANNIEDKDVLIVEDIVDTAKTMNTVYNMLARRNPKSLKVLTLLDKPDNRKIDFKPDMFGFKINKEDFVVGFGFDIDEKKRNLPYIGTFKKRV
ncbi:hypoxanthine phosphoribosyltransferase [[Mycoplasma] falconis]|uniref:Hypoxanthine phosphoribosyltransferase n=1 Tax=[Mycoplasma] falconis TaxID=92403 RepID=A0A501X9Z0_9BACT|nr:hypoxanthine phosphoribosyltransferase [[Mycoplasma] falconis]TPE57418.1 hypoxanthine phosphoribosyltransferase [[Mycoplasma] falconis]